MDKEQIYCDGLDCAYCLDPNCPKDKIIVDDVNVKYCKYFRFEKCNKTGMPCASDKNCYYKLLQREIAKNEHLLKIADIRQETIINLARCKKELEQILAEMKNILVRF